MSLTTAIVLGTLTGLASGRTDGVTADETKKQQKETRRVSARFLRAPLVDQMCKRRNFR